MRVPMHPKFLLIPLLALFASAVPAQSGNFQIAFHGKPVGETQFRVASPGPGLSSTVRLNLAAQQLEYATSTSAELTAGHSLRKADLNAVVNGQAVHLTATVAAGALTLAITANGRTTTTLLDAHPAMVLLPDFDAGALETLLRLATAHNGRDLWVILPKKSGSVKAAQITTYADEKGTLDGKPVAVHHLSLGYAGTKTELFSGAENQLLQAELPQPGFALVRKGFVLTPPAKAPAAPADTTPQE